MADTIIAANHSGIRYEGRHVKDSVSARSGEPGFGFRWGYTGDICKVRCDTSLLASYPFLVGWVDGKRVRTRLASNLSEIELLPDLNSTTQPPVYAHSAEILLDSINAANNSNGNGWQALVNGLTVLGLTLASNGTMLAAPPARPPIEFHGDSIAQGDRVLYYPSAGTSDAIHGSAEFSWPRRTARAIGCDAVIAGHGGGGITMTSASGAPIPLNAYDYVYATVPYTPEVPPVAIVIYYGTNDSGSVSPSTFVAAYTTYLNKIRSVRGPQPWIYVITPRGAGIYATAMAAMAAGRNDSRMRHLDFSGTLSGGPSVYDNTDSPDNIHPSVSGCTKMVAVLAPVIAADLAADAAETGPPANPASGYTVTMPNSVTVDQNAVAVVTLAGGPTLDAPLVVTLAGAGLVFDGPVTIAPGAFSGSTPFHATTAGARTATATHTGGNSSMGNPGPFSITAVASRPLRYLANLNA